MRSKPFATKVAYVAALAILLAVNFFAGSLAIRGRPVNAQDASSPANPAAPEGEFWCTIKDVAVFRDRIHVWCPDHAGPIVYFAAPVASAAESRQANRYLAILNTAYALGKQVYVYYDDNPTANPPGCLTDGCRLITGLMIVP